LGFTAKDAKGAKGGNPKLTAEAAESAEKGAEKNKLCLSLSKTHRKKHGFMALAMQRS
jgi:hypothetical protein